MSKFNKLVEKMSSLPDPVLALKFLKAMKKEWEEGVWKYATLELRNDWWQEHYTNSRVALEAKVDAIDAQIASLEANGISVQAPEGSTKV